MIDQLQVEKSRSKRQSKKAAREFRIGKALVYQRGKVWYLQYRENGQRNQPRVGPDKDVAHQLASQINSQLEIGAVSALSS